MKRALVATGIILAPSLAWACPTCAARPSGGIGIWLLLGLMLLVPYTVAFFVIRAVRRSLRSEAPAEEARP